MNEEDSVGMVIEFKRADGKVIMTFMADGTIIKGDGLSNERATADLFEVMSLALPSWMMALRQRAERAESLLKVGSRAPDIH